MYSGLQNMGQKQYGIVLVIYRVSNLAGVFVCGCSEHAHSYTCWSPSASNHNIHSRGAQLSGQVFKDTVHGESETWIITW